MNQETIDNWDKTGHIYLDLYSKTSVGIQMTRTKGGYDEGPYFAFVRADVAKLRDALTAWLDDTAEESADTYYVTSDSDPTLNYKVRRFSGGRWDCTCPDHTNRDRNCKHIERAMEYRNGYSVLGVMSEGEWKKGR